MPTEGVELAQNLAARALADIAAHSAGCLEYRKRIDDAIQSLEDQIAASKESLQEQFLGFRTEVRADIRDLYKQQTAFLSWIIGVLIAASGAMATYIWMTGGHR